MPAVRDILTGRFDSIDCPVDLDSDEWRNPRLPVRRSADTLPGLPRNDDDDAFQDPDFAMTFWETQLLDRHNDEYGSSEEESDPFPGDVYPDYSGDRYAEMADKIITLPRSASLPDNENETGIAVSPNNACYMHGSYPQDTVFPPFTPTFTGACRVNLRRHVPKWKPR